MTQKIGNNLTVKDLFKQLRNAYKDYKSTERVVRKLNVLRQDIISFNTFLTEFDCTILKIEELY